MSTQPALLLDRGRATQPPGGRRWSWRWDRWTWYAVLTAFGVVALAAVAAATTGSWEIPHADAWSYQKTALTFFHTGHFRLQGWGEMFLLGQIVTAVPLMAVFGANFGSLNLYGALAGVALLGLAFAIARPLVGKRRAFAVLLTVSVFPAFGPLASSFMTDLPCAMTALLCVFVGAVAIRRMSAPLFALSVAIGLWGFTIREQSIAGLFAVIVTALVAPQVSRRFRVGAALAGAATVVACVGLEHIRHAMPNADAPPWGLGTIRLDHLPPSLLPALFTLGFAIAPLAVWCLAGLRGRDWLDPGRLAGWSLGVLALVIVVHRSGSFYVTLPNYLNRYGSYASAAVGLSRPVFGPDAWALVERVAAFGGIVLAGEICQVLSRPRRAIRYLRQAGPLAIAVSIYGGVACLGVVGLAFAGQLQFDRYLLPLVVPAGVLLVRRPVRVRLVRPIVITACAMVFAVLGAVAANITFATDARDGARWDAAARLARAGVPADQINAGLEWNGIHSSVAADPMNKLGLGRPDRYGGQYWTKVFDRSTDCWVVSMSSDVGVTHARLVEIRRIHPYAWQPRTAYLYVFERTRCKGAFRPPPPNS